MVKLWTRTGKKTPQELDMSRQNGLEVRDASVFTHVTER